MGTCTPEARRAEDEAPFEGPQLRPSMPGSPINLIAVPEESG